MPIIYLLWWLYIYSGGPLIGNDLNSVKIPFPRNFEILPWNGGVLSRGQTQGGVNVDFKFDVTLKIKGSSPIKQRAS